MKSTKTKLPTDAEIVSSVRDSVTSLNLTLAECARRSIEVAIGAGNEPPTEDDAKLGHIHRTAVTVRLWKVL